MLSYQHDYHAGNHADVLKHAVLALVIRALQKKPAAIRVIDSHAGSGIYDLASSEARRNAEFADGIGRVLAEPLPPVELKPYLEVVRAVNGPGSAHAGGLGRYPGSPEIARQLLRPDDHLDLLELHPGALARLRRHYGRDRRVHVHERDAFEGLPALVPPSERRGVVLVDPAFEVKADFASVAGMLASCHRRWPGGVYLVWYPLIRHPLAERFPARIRATGMPKLLQAELQVEIDAFDGMRGSGLVIVNPPFGLEDQLNVLLPWLWQALRNDDRTGWRVRALA